MHMRRASYGSAPPLNCGVRRRHVREVIVSIIALLAASLWTGLVVAALAVFDGSPVTEVLIEMLVASAFALVPAFVFGGILFVALRSIRLVRWWSAALAGVSVGAPISVLGAGDAVLLVVCVFAGASAGLAFWAVWSVGMRSQSARR
jgi:hypothetical protein